MGDPPRDNIGDVLVEQLVRSERDGEERDALGQLETADEP